MAGVAGQYQIDIAVDGRALPLNASNITQLAIINNIHQYLPVLSLGFKDSPSVLNGDLGRVPDGATVNISIGNPSHHVYEGRQFELTGSPSKSPELSYSTIGLNGIFARGDWTRKVVDTLYSGSSADVVRQLGSAMGWRVEADTTQDTMDWLPNNTVFAQFAKHVVDRGWAGAQSIMMMAASDSGLLAYRDIDQLARGTPRRTFSSVARDGATPILAYAATTKSMVANVAGASGATSMGMRPDGTWYEVNKIASTLMSGRLSVRDAVDAVQSVANLAQGGLDGLVNGLAEGAKRDLGRRIQQFAPLGGNTHEHWYEAQHQNKRGRSLYAYDVSILSHVPLQVDLLDLVRLVPVDNQTGRVDEALVGNYVVTANTKFLSHNGFYEKAVLTSQGTN